MYSSTPDNHTQSSQLKGQHSYGYMSSGMCVYTIYITSWIKTPIVFVLLPTLPELPDFFSFRTNQQVVLETRCFLATFCLYIYKHNLYCHLLEKREPQHLNEIYLLDLLVFVYSPVFFSFFQEGVSFTLKIVLPQGRS